MYIIIAGCGRVGEELLEKLSKEEVVVIESNPSRAKEIAENYDVLVINDDGCNIKVLEDANVKKADVFVAVTGDDKANLMMSLLAKKMGAKKVISRVNIPSNIEIFQQLGVDIPLCPITLASAAIKNAIYGIGRTSIMPLSKGLAEILQFTVDKDLAGKKIEELELPKECLIIGLSSKDEFKIPRGHTKLAEGDILTVVAKKEVVEKLYGIFKPPKVGI